MASKNKKKKAKNAYCRGVLKNSKGERLKRIFFYTPSERQKEKKNED